MTPCLRNDSTDSSFSSRLRFFPLSAVAVFSFLLCSRAIRNCSASSYAASRLFMVQRRLPAVLSVLIREVRVSLDLALDSSIGGDGEVSNEGRSLRGR